MVTHVSQHGLAEVGTLGTESPAQLSEDSDVLLVALKGDTMVLVQLLQPWVSARAGQRLKAEREQLIVADEATSRPESEVTQVNHNCRLLVASVGNVACDDSLVVVVVDDSKEESTGEERLRAHDRFSPDGTVDLLGRQLSSHVHPESDVALVVFQELGRVVPAVLEKQYELDALSLRLDISSSLTLEDVVAD